MLSLRREGIDQGASMCSTDLCSTKGRSCFYPDGLTTSTSERKTNLSANSSTPGSTGSGWLMLPNEAR